MAKRSVLIIAHDYPPIRSAGTERVLNLARHIAEFDFEPLILTTGRYGGDARDLVDRVCRSGDWLDALAAPLARRRRTHLSPADQARVATVSNSSWLGRVRDAVLVPDTKLGWLFPASRRGRVLVDHHRPDLLFSSSPPETAHLVAARIHAASGLPWIADFRDGWMFEPPRPELRTLPVRRRVEGWLERRVVRNVAALTAVTDPICEDFVVRYPETAGRVYTVPNGYAASEFAGLNRQRRPDGTFLLVHTGGLAASRQGRTAGPFFDAIKQVSSDSPSLQLRVQFVGATTPQERAEADSRGLANIVSFEPPVPRRDAHQLQLDADGLLLITEPGRRSVASLKLYDYIGAGIPVLGLTEGSAAANIIRKYAIGVTAAPDDPTAIGQAMRDLIERQRAGSPWGGFPSAQRDFEWREIAGRLAQVFRAVA